MHINNLWKHFSLRKPLGSLYSIPQKLQRIILSDCVLLMSPSFNKSSPHTNKRRYRMPATVRSFLYNWTWWGGGNVARTLPSRSYGFLERNIATGNQGSRGERAKEPTPAGNSPGPRQCRERAMEPSRFIPKKAAFQGPKQGREGE